MAVYVCEKCGKRMKDDNFYTYQDGTKVEICKKCLTMHVDNFNPDTYTWILKKLDVPYIPEEWQRILDKAYANDPLKINGLTVLGKYLSKMKLTQFKGKNWADTEAILAERKEQQEKIKKDQEELAKETTERYLNGEISEAEYRTLTATVEQEKMRTMEEMQKGMAEASQKAADEAAESARYNNTPFDERLYMDEEDMPHPENELTKEDKIALAVKWGRTYRPDEWIALEKHYTEMSTSFAIEDADTQATLLMLSKVNLKMNQAIDIGDLESALKASRMYDSLRKSAKFQAVQNKEGKQSAFDAIGCLVGFCEREGGFIPRYATNIPKDKVDLTIQDLKNFNKKLVTEDLGFGQQIEDTLKKLQLQKEQKEAEDAEEPEFLKEEDYEKYYEEVEKQKTADFISQSYDNDNAEVDEVRQEYKKQNIEKTNDLFDNSFDM